MVDVDVPVVGGAPRRLTVLVPQGYDMEVDIRFVNGLPTGPAGFPSLVFGCQPRQGALRQSKEPHELEESLWEKVQSVADQLFEWLNRSEANARLYFVNPASALAKAGLGLSVSELKTLDRVHSAASKQLLVGPGVGIVGFAAAAGTPKCASEQEE